MRRWYAAALQRIAHTFEECESGWELLFHFAEDRPCDLVVANKTLPGLGGAQVLAMLRTADAHVPFVLIAPLCDSGVRSLVNKMPNAALIEDSLDGVRLAEVAESLVRSSSRRGASADKVRRAVALAGRRGLRQRRALG